MTLRHLLLPMLLLTLLAACQDDYLVPSGTAAPRTRELPEPTTPFEPPPGAFTLLTLHDAGCDGGAGYCAWTTYDAAGQLLHQERRSGCDTDSPSCELTWLSEEGATVTAYDDRCEGRLRWCEHRLETERRTLYAVDEDCDGAFDVRHVTERDARGVVVLSRSDSAQGTAEASCRTSWPDAAASGEPLYDSEDEGCDGVPEHCRVILRDAAGRAVGRGTDAGCDGVYEACELNTLGGPDSILATPEGAGCQEATLSCTLSEQRADPLGTWFINTEDPACDGHPVGCSRGLRTPEGRWLSYGWDEDCDGVDDRSCLETTLEHDGEVRTFTSQKDDDCDGVPETCTRWTQGASGVVFSEAQDLGCDGTDDSCYTTTHDAAGRVLDAWYGCDEPEVCIAWRYDDAGNLTYEQEEWLCAENGRHCMHWGYDAMGYIDYVADDTDCDGRLDWCFSYILDANGFKLSSTQDDDCDGQPESCKVATWDPRGFELSFTRDDGCDGTPDLCSETIPLP